MRGEPFVLADGTVVSQELFPSLSERIRNILVANNSGLIRHAIKRFSGIFEYSEEVVEG
ncbi:MAG TPA: hypothetical protein PK765_06625 [bacterium]|nr:hypothetical protein [bacterium]